MVLVGGRVGDLDWKANTVGVPMRVMVGVLVVIAIGMAVGDFVGAVVGELVET